MTINYYYKNVYGNEHIYIKDELQADIISGLTGKKTVSQYDINYLRKLGCTLTEVIPPR